MEKLKSIYSQTYNFVYLRAKSILEREEDIQQLMKEVYLKAVSEDIDDALLYEWLGKQVYTLGCSKFRKKKVREAKRIEIENQCYRAAEGVERETTKQIVCGILENLPDMYQATLYAFYYDHMKMKDISAVMGYNVGAIINRLNYIHKYVEKALSDYREENQVEVQFAVDVVCEALRDWSAENRLNSVVAQNIFVSICRELGYSSEGACVEAQLAGANRRITEVETDEVLVVSEELERYSVDKSIAVKKVLRNVLKTMGVIVAIIVAVALFMFAKDWIKQSEKEVPVVEEEVTDTQQEVQQETNQEAEQQETDQVAEQQETDQEAEQQEATKPTDSESVEDSGYILPNSDKQKLTREDLNGLTKEQLRLARNEIYARHGVIFGTKDLDDYFATKSWYKPTISLTEFYEKVEMSLEEESNIILIQQEEKGR